MKQKMRPNYGFSSGLKSRSHKWPFFAFRQSHHTEKKKLSNAICKPKLPLQQYFR